MVPQLSLFWLEFCPSNLCCQLQLLICSCDSFWALMCFMLALSVQTIRAWNDVTFYYGCFSFRAELKNENDPTTVDLCDDGYCLLHLNGWFYDIVFFFLCCKQVRYTVFNVGDSRAFIGFSDGKFQPLTNDHKPSRPEEHQRIIKAGGSVAMDRVVSFNAGWKWNLWMNLWWKGHWRSDLMFLFIKSCLNFSFRMVNLLSPEQSETGVTKITPPSLLMMYDIPISDSSQLPDFLSHML